MIFKTFTVPACLCFSLFFLKGEHKLSVKKFGGTGKVVKAEVVLEGGDVWFYCSVGRFIQVELFVLAKPTKAFLYLNTPITTTPVHNNATNITSLCKVVHRKHPDILNMEDIQPSLGIEEATAMFTAENNVGMRIGK